MDVALPELCIAVEADGPTHFLRNRRERNGLPRPSGETRVRDRLLAAWGWTVVSVPYTVWELASQDEFRTLTHIQLVARIVLFLRRHTNLLALMPKAPEGAAAAAAAAEDAAVAAAEAAAAAGQPAGTEAVPAAAEELASAAGPSAAAEQPAEPADSTGLDC